MQKILYLFSYTNAIKENGCDTVWPSVCLYDEHWTDTDEIWWRCWWRTKKKVIRFGFRGSRTVYVQLLYQPCLLRAPDGGTIIGRRLTACCLLLANDQILPRLAAHKAQLCHKHSIKPRQSTATVFMQSERGTIAGKQFSSGRHRHRHQSQRDNCTDNIIHTQTGTMQQETKTYRKSKRLITSQNNS